MRQMPRISWLEQLLGVDLTSSLPQLILEGPKFTDAQLDKIITLIPELESLDLINTQISDAGVEAVTRLAKLRMLCIDGSPLTEVALVPIGRCDNLKQLELRNLPISIETLEPLCAYTTYSYWFSKT